MAAGTLARLCAPALAVTFLATVPVAAQAPVEAAHAGPGEAEESGHEAASGGAHHGAGGGGEHGGKGGHHIKASVIGTTTAVMLLGFVAFIMALFYLVNWHDEDIKQYTWVMVSCTVSIFLAVLTFSALAGCVKFFLPESILTDAVQFLTFWIVTQGCLFIVREKEEYPGEGSGATPQEAGSLMIQPPDEEDDEGRPNIPLKAFGTIMAHITGFAGIRFFGTLQVNEHLWFSTSTLASSVVPLIAGLVGYALSLLSEFARKRLITKFGDKKEDEGEEAWREQCRDSEDDAVGLFLSFTLNVCIRYGITHTVPSLHGATKGRTVFEVICLFAVGGLLVAIVVLITCKLNNVEKSVEERRKTNSVHHQKLFDTERFVKFLSILASLTMSWCLYFAAQWGFFTFLHVSLRGVTGKLMEAVFLSFVCMLVIFLLDFVGDGSKSCKKALKGVITALSLLVGISWEGAFAMGVDEIAANWHTPGQVVAVKTLMCLSLVLTVLPAWRLYIMPKSDPVIMKYYHGHSPPLISLCKRWDPVKDFRPSKSQQIRDGIRKSIENALTPLRAS